MFEPGTLGLLALLGAWTALDGTAFGQIMVSRPMVSATIGGWLLGDPGTGFLIGAILEGIHLAGFPVGAARLPEPGPAVIPGVALALHLGGPAGIALGTGFAVGWSLVGGSSVVAQRRLNGRLVGGAEDGRWSAGALSARHWACVGADALRGALLTVAGLVLIYFVPATLGERWPFDGPTTVGFLLMPVALAAGMLLRGWARPRTRGIVFVAATVGGWALAQWM